MKEEVFIAPLWGAGVIWVLLRAIAIAPLWGACAIGAFSGYRYITSNEVSLLNIPHIWYFPKCPQRGQIAIEKCGNPKPTNALVEGE